MSKPIERRIVDANLTVRSNADGSIGVRGYAAIFDSPAHGEVIRSSAFNRTLAQRDNIRLLVNHDGVPLATTKSNTLMLGTDARGLWFDAPSLDPANPDVQRLVSAMSRGDIDQCSFAGWFTDVRSVDGLQEVYEVKGTDVSIVTYPWYEDTTVALTGNGRADKALISARSLPIQERRTLVAEALRAAPPGKTSYGDLACQLCDAITETLSLGGAEPWLWIDDLGSDWAVYSLFDGDDWDYFQIPYKLAKDGTLTLGVPFEVEIVTEYRPMTPEEIAADDAPTRGLTVAQARALLGTAA